MINLEIIAFIEHQKAAGVQEADIAKILLEGGGWSKSDIQEAFSIAGMPPGSLQAAQIRAAVLRNETYKKTGRGFIVKFFVFIIFLGCIGGAGYFITRPVETRLAFIEKISSFSFTSSSTLQFTSRAQEFIGNTIEKVHDVISSKTTQSPTETISSSTPTESSGSASPSSSTSSLTPTSTLALVPTSTPNSTPETFAPIVPTSCGNFTYADATEASDGISHSKCFSAKFKICAPATFSGTVADYTTLFTIKEKSGDTCVVTEEISGPSLSQPQKLMCSFRSDSDWASVQEDSSNACKAVH